jgi:hypothetical protein
VSAIYLRLFLKAYLKIIEDFIEIRNISTNVESISTFPYFAYPKFIYGIINDMTSIEYELYCSLNCLTSLFYLFPHRR